MAKDHFARIRAPSLRAPPSTRPLSTLVAPSAQCRRRTRLVGDPFAGATGHQRLDELLEDHSIGYARPMTAEGMIGSRSRQQRRELLPDGLDDVCRDGGHERVPSSGSFDNSPDDGTSRAQFSCATDPYWRKLLAAGMPSVTLVSRTADANRRQRGRSRYRVCLHP